MTYTYKTYKTAKAWGVGYLKDGSYGMGELDMDHPSQTAYREATQRALKYSMQELKEDLNAIHDQREAGL